MLKNKQKKTILFTIMIFFTQSLFALVDYSENEIRKAPSPSRPRKMIKNAPPQRARAQTFGQSRGRSPREKNKSSTTFLDLSFSVDTQKVNSEDISTKMSLYNFSGHFQTPYQLFFDFRYWFGKTDHDEIAKSSSSQKGNGIFKMGFNWLTFGSGANKTAINLYAGGMLKSSDTHLGSSRTDKIFGIETIKTFYSFVLGLGYEMRLTGTPKNDDEIDLGNINTLTVAAGLRVSPDIDFLLESIIVNFTPGDHERGEGLFISEKSSYAYLKAALKLQLSPRLELELGGNFRTKKLKKSRQFISAKIWDLSAAYGNTIFAGFNFSL